MITYFLPGTSDLNGRLTRLLTGEILEIQVSTRSPSLFDESLQLRECFISPEFISYNERYGSNRKICVKVPE